MIFDGATMGQAYAGPGMDTRQWVSFATVDDDSKDNRSVQFTKEYGPLVNCTLHPSAVPVVCRVANAIAGNGEGEWFPFIGGDEVLVAIPEGDEKAGCTIIGRLNQEIDAFPTLVAGQDPSLNTFAFRRLRTPYILETASSYLLRSAISGAFLSIDQVGNITLSNQDNGFLSIGSQLIGLQNGPADVLMQIDVDNKQINLQANGTRLQIDGSATNFLTKGSLTLGTAGGNPIYHVATVESVANILGAFLNFLALAAPSSPPQWAALRATFPAVIITAANTPVSPDILAAVATGLSSQASNPASGADTTGAFAGIGKPSFFV